MTWIALGDYLLDHAAGIVGAMVAAWVAIRQSRGQQKLFDINLNIDGVRRDLHNGAGDSIAAKTAQHIAPIIEQTGKEITTEVARSNAEVAAVLADKQTIWDGVERRNGPPDRRGQ